MVNHLIAHPIVVSALVYPSGSSCTYVHTQHIHMTENDSHLRRYIVDASANPPVLNFCVSSANSDLIANISRANCNQLPKFPTAIIILYRWSDAYFCKKLYESISVC